MTSLTIGQVARQADVGVETIRYYERLGLIAPPKRRPSGYRAFTEGAVRRLRFIRRAKFVSGNDPALYGGAGLLITASFWNSWPRPATEGGADSMGLCCRDSAPEEGTAGIGTERTGLRFS